EQFLEDGGHFERSATYHGWLITGLLELVELHRASGRRPPASWMPAIARALEWYSRVECPDGTVPLFNDAALDFCPMPGEWLGLRPRVEPRRVDVLPETGWLVARAGEAVVVADVGPIGASYVPAHAHADQLTFELFVGRQRLAVDYGVSRYAAGAERSFCRST